MVEIWQPVRQKGKCPPLATDSQTAHQTAALIFAPLLFCDGYDNVVVDDDNDDVDDDDDDFAYCLHTGTRSAMMAYAAYKLCALKASISHSY